MASVVDVESLKRAGAVALHPPAQINETTREALRMRFDLAEMEVEWDPETAALWSFMTPEAGPKYTPSLLRDLRRWQIEAKRIHEEGLAQLRYIVFGCRHPDAFNLGGDLEYVAGLIERRDRSGLEAYGNACVEMLYDNLHSLSLPIVTVALIQGDAAGGGIESALSFNVLIAEHDAKFSFPDDTFGMFPGIGAHSLLTRRVGAAMAERIMFSGKIYTAQEMYELGLVHVIAEPGEGEATVRQYIRQNQRRFNGRIGAYRAALEVNPIRIDELQSIVRIWADTGLNLSEQQMKLMRRFAIKQVAKV